MNAATYAPTWPLQGGAGRQEESAPPSVLLEPRGRDALEKKGSGAQLSLAVALQLNQL